MTTNTINDANIGIDANNANPTIAESIGAISNEVQNVFEELIKLVLRKTFRPTINPLRNNERLIYNPYTGRNERTIVGSSGDDQVAKYNYSLDNDSLGWAGPNVTTFRAVAKIIKNRFPYRRPEDIHRTSKLILSKLAYSDRQSTEKENIAQSSNFDNFVDIVISRNMLSTIANGRGAYIYECDVSYIDCFKQLELIGKEMVNQTDASIPPEVSARLSTAFLRIKLHNLEQALRAFSISDPLMYCFFREMIRLINSQPRVQTLNIITLIGVLSFQDWDSLGPLDRQFHINNLGEAFINDFLENDLITVLLQNGQSELILTASYLFSLLKMLYIVFGFNELNPLLSDFSFSTTQQSLPVAHLQKHYDRYVGSRMTRGQNGSETFDTGSQCSTSSSCPTSVCPDCQPVDPCIIAFIRIFCDVYPNITSYMGGCENLPEEVCAIDCNNIPLNYNNLESVPQMLSRFNDFAFCTYMDYVNSRVVNVSVNAKVNSKIRYLRTL